MRIALFALLILSACASAPPPEPLVNRASVRVDRELARGIYRFRVDGAAGRDQEEAKAQALEAALEFAARQVTGDPEAKSAATNYVADNRASLSHYASPGPIFRRNMANDRFELGMYVVVQTRELERELVEASVIRSARELSKAVDRPTLMVVPKSVRCDERADGARCGVEQQIRALGASLEEAKDAAYAYQTKVVESGCVDQEKVKALIDAHGVTHLRARRGVLYRGFYRPRVYVGGVSASAVTRHHYHSVVDQVRSSPNCQPLVDGLREREARLADREARMDQLQDALGRLGQVHAERGLTRTKLDQYLVDARLEVVDAGAVEQAQRTEQALGAVAGLPEDPAARLAQLAGADVYLEFESSESLAGGGYQMELGVRAFDVVSGKLLASQVGRSRRLADSDPGSALTEAAGKVMPVVLEQIQTFWSEAVREGARTRIVVRGNVGPIKRDVVKALDEVGKAFRECGMDLSCGFELGTTTASTLEGELVLPARRRARAGLEVEGALGDEGLGVEVVVSNPSLTIVRVY